MSSIVETFFLWFGSLPRIIQFVSVIGSFVVLIGLCGLADFFGGQIIDSGTASPNSPLTHSTTTATIAASNTTLTVFITQAQIQGDKLSQIAIATDPGTQVQAQVEYTCNHTLDHDLVLGTQETADAQGEVHWRWTPHPPCDGTAIVTITANDNGVFASATRLVAVS